MTHITRIPDLREHPDVPQEIVEAAVNGELVLFVGAGISMLCNLPSWATLADQALKQLVDGEVINYWVQEQLKHLDPKTKLSVASIIASQSGVRLNVSTLLEADPNNTSSIYSVLNGLGCVCVTTNYDHLLEPVTPRCAEVTSSPVATRATNRVFRREDIHSGLLDVPGTVVHLHGSIAEPGNMVLTTSDYLTLYDRGNISAFLSHLFANKTVLFIGYGLNEAEILEYILRRGNAEKRRDRMRFALQGYFQTHDVLYQNLHAYYAQSFGVHVIGFKLDYKWYGQQEEIFRAWASKILVRPTPLTEDLKQIDKVLGG
jgi:hypothetical protein